MPYRIAIASSTGESVDQHFGQASNFLIYEVSDNGIDFIEDREVPRDILGVMHKDENLERIINLLEDCSAVFILKIGVRTARFLEQHNIKYFEVNFSLNRIFTRLMQNKQKGRVKIL